MEHFRSILKRLRAFWRLITGQTAVEAIRQLSVDLAQRMEIIEARLSLAMRELWDVRNRLFEIQGEALSHFEQLDKQLETDVAGLAQRLELAEARLSLLIEAVADEQVQTSHKLAALCSRVICGPEEFWRKPMVRGPKELNSRERQ